LFSGSDNFNYTYINAGWNASGATNLNGTTDSDRTNYFENVPTSMLDYVLFAESDRMGPFARRSLTRKKLDLQRVVWCRTKNARAKTNLTASPGNS